MRSATYWSADCVSCVPICSELRETHLAALLDSLLRLPSVGVSLGVRVAVLVGHVRKHGIHHTRVGGGGSLGVQVDGAADIAAASGLSL